MKKKNNLLSKFSVPMAALLAGLLMIGGTLGYLSSVTPARTNVFTKGSVETELLEPGFNVEETTINKNPYVTNVGDVDCIVRLKVEISPSEIEVPLAENPSASGGLDATMTDAEATALWAEGYRFWLNFNTVAADNTDRAAWVYNTADGYWYYQGVISPSEDTSELFTEVKWLIIEDNKFKDIQDFDIFITKESTYASYVDARDVEHNALTSAGTYDADAAAVIWEAMETEGKIF